MPAVDRSNSHAAPVEPFAQKQPGQSGDLEEHRIVDQA
jgi:hypothetical protein